MRVWLFDASALAKRYVRELGTDTINTLVDEAPWDQLLCISFGTLEVLSVIVRARNDKRLTMDAAERSTDRLHWEVLLGSMPTLHPSAGLVVQSAPFVTKHSINGTDAIVLQAALNLRDGMRVLGDEVILVASDTRLLRAAEAEGLPILNPEKQSPADVQALLTAGP